MPVFAHKEHDLVGVIGYDMVRLFGPLFRRMPTAHRYGHIIGYVRV